MKCLKIQCDINEWTQILVVTAIFCAFVFFRAPDWWFNSADPVHAARPPDHIPPQPDPGECCGALQLQGRGCKGPEVSAHVSLSKVSYTCQSEQTKIKKTLFLGGLFFTLKWCSYNRERKWGRLRGNPVFLLSFWCFPHLRAVQLFGWVQTMLFLYLGSHMEDEVGSHAVVSYIAVLLWFM